MQFTTAVVSGMHSGPNPSPGLGVARSLRLAHPGMRIIGLDYSRTSSGLHSPVVDEIVLLPSWEWIQERTWLDHIDSIVADEGTVFIPTLDLEVRLLAARLGAHDRILGPGKAALEVVTKPATALAEALGCSVPQHETDTSPAAVERFLRRSPHGAWVKGQHYEAFRARFAGEALAAGKFVIGAWGGQWHLEAHVPGQECGLAFCAVRGRLLDAVFMTKAILTADGKSWSGEVAELPGDLWDRLAEFVAEVDWNGGGEVELIRSWEGDLTVMELNPRFPAWIHGASVCGANLPSVLLGGEGVRNGRALTGGFTRVVEEIPVLGTLGIAPFPWGIDGIAAPATKHPSGMRQLGRRQLLPPLAPFGRTRRASSREHRGYGAHLRPPTVEEATPRREIMPDLLTRQVEALTDELRDLPDAVIAYSIKTCPHPVLLRRARDLGLVAEAISLDELSIAVDAGFDEDGTILNGPAKWWPPRADARCWAFFADSIDELERLEQRLDGGFALTCALVGIRVAPTTLPSRFGLRVQNTADLQRAATLLGRMSRNLGAAWGIHFHYAESTIGPERWQREAAASLSVADRIADRIGCGPAVVDIGGGWHVNDLGHLRSSLGYVIENGPTALADGSARVLLEPGKLLTEPAAAVVTRVLARVGSGEDGTATVDAALGDVPESRYHAHPVARFDGRRWDPLASGEGRIFGRSCMENDVLAEGVDLTAVAVGDALAFGMCGAYDLSMAYSFGRGVASGGLT